MKIALICIAKNEDHYIDEWIDYHLKLGVSNVFIYQHNWRYHGKYDNDVRVAKIPFDIDVAQLNAYNNFIANYSRYFDFGMFFDVDEFLSIKDDTLENVLGRCKDVNQVSVNWRFFGDSGLIDIVDDNYSLVNRFTKCSASLNKHVKAILNFARLRHQPVNATFMNPHFANIVSTSIDMKHCFFGPFLQRAADDTSCGIQLNHYYCKTRQEFLNIKIARGRPDVANSSTMQSFNQVDNMLKLFDDSNLNEIEDLTAKNFFNS